MNIEKVREGPFVTLYLGNRDLSRTVNVNGPDPIFSSQQPRRLVRIQ
jgi:hypothetical protein